jgi:hypothetical protein
MRRQAHTQRHTIIYENDGLEIARYTVSADSERTAERRTTKLFFKRHPEFDELGLWPALTFRIEGAAKGAGGHREIGRKAPRRSSRFSD